MRRRSAAWSVERHKCFVYKRIRFVATTPRARKRKLLPHAGHEFGLASRLVANRSVSRIVYGC